MVFNLFEWMLGADNASDAPAKVYQLQLTRRIKHLLDPNDTRGLEKRLVKDIGDHLRDNSVKIAKFHCVQLEVHFTDASDYRDLTIDLGLLNEQISELVKPQLVCEPIEECAHEYNDENQSRVLHLMLAP